MSWIVHRYLCSESVWFCFISEPVLRPWSEGHLWVYLTQSFVNIPIYVNPYKFPHGEKLSTCTCVGRSEAFSHFFVLLGAHYSVYCRKKQRREKGKNTMKALHRRKDNGLTLIHLFCNSSLSVLKFHLRNFSIVLLYVTLILVLDLDPMTLQY